MSKKSWVGFILILSLQGCASPFPRRLHYGGGDIVIGTPHQVDTFCQEGAQFWDDGSRIERGQHSAGCHDDRTHDIWVRNDCVGAEALPHELCHRDGNTECEAYDWP